MQLYELHLKTKKNHEIKLVKDEHEMKKNKDLPEYTKEMEEFNLPHKS